MTSGKMQIHSFGLLWLLTSVYIVRVSTPWTAAKRSPLSTFALIIQRPRMAGGLLTIPLDSTFRLLQCSSKDFQQNIIRLQYGSSGKHLVMRMSNSTEREMWYVAILSSLAPVRVPKAKSLASTSLRGSFKPVPTSAVAEPTVSSKVTPTPAARTLPPHSIDAFKSLADGYDKVALQWTQVTAQTRQFSAQIAGLQPPRIEPESCAVHCSA